jgi:excisionase family DNA binding protein
MKFRRETMSTTIAGETYYTLQEVADGVGVHYQTVRTWINEGTLNASKIGKSYRVPEAELKRLLSSHKADAKVEVA